MMKQLCVDMSDDFKAYPVQDDEKNGVCVPKVMTILSLGRTKTVYCSVPLLASRSRCSFCGARRRALMNQLLTCKYVNMLSRSS